ncbi:MAG: class I SAM-dependent methyltransferase [Acidimicrobiales bacterium]
MTTSLPTRHQHDGNAEFDDALAFDAWEVLRPALAAALTGVDPEAGPVLDVGAGTGLATEVVADTVPDATIVAVEPSRALRAGLMTRIMSRPGLRRRVTVLPTDLAGARLPARLGAVVAVNMLGHLAPDERRGFWRLLATRLAPGAPAVIGLQPPAQPEVVADTHFTRVQIGDRHYQGWGRADPTGPETVRWTMTWRVLLGDQVVDERTGVYDWWTVGDDVVTAELADVGLGAVPGGAGLVIARQPEAP